MPILRPQSRTMAGPAPRFIRSYIDHSEISAICAAIGTLMTRSSIKSAGISMGSLLAFDAMAVSGIDRGRAALLAKTKARRHDPRLGFVDGERGVFSLWLSDLTHRPERVRSALTRGSSVSNSRKPVKS